MKAIILCAGRGTRLQPLTDTTPKTLLLVKGKSILEHILENLPDEIHEVILIVDYLQEQIISFCKENAHKFHFSLRCVPQIKDQKGTLAALLSVRHLISQGERFLVLNGDDLVAKSDLEKMLIHHRSFAVQHAVMPNYYKVEDQNGILNSFAKQTEQEQKNGVRIATGTYVLDDQIFDFPYTFLKGNEIGIPQTILQHKNMYSVSVVEFSTWKPINTIDDFEEVDR